MGLKFGVKKMSNQKGFKFFTEEDFKMYVTDDDLSLKEAALLEIVYQLKLIASKLK